MSFTRRGFLTTVTAGVSRLGAQGRKRPNILFIMADDHASHAISAYGSKINRTPNLDRIAQEGARLTNCFCTNSICTPSRAAILTGQYSHTNGVYTLQDPLDPQRDNVAKQLQKAGYQTAIVGKWHLHTEPAGFDYHNILPGQGLYYDPVFLENGQKKQHKGYCTDLIADFSLDWLKQRDKSKPFFLMCHHKAPHRPWGPSSKYAGFLKDANVPEPATLYEDLTKEHAKSVASVKMRVGEDNTPVDMKQPIPVELKGAELRKWAYQQYIKDYLRCVQSVDDNVGRLLDYLKAESIENDTVVIYTSDQGFFLGDHGLYDKRLMYEESLRMPFLIRHPDAIRPGTVNHNITLNIDFAPTFLDYAGASVPAEIQGRSFRQNVQSKAPSNWRKAMYYRY